MTNNDELALKTLAEPDSYKIPSMPERVSAQDMRETLNVPMFEEEAQAAANGFNQCLLECAPIHEAAQRMRRGIDKCLNEMDGMQQSIDYGYRRRNEWRKRAEEAEGKNAALLAERDADKKRIAELVSAIGSINHGKHHEVMIPGDDEPVYWQRKEWVEWILELAAGINLEVGE